MEKGDKMFWREKRVLWRLEKSREGRGFFFLGKDFLKWKTGSRLRGFSGIKENSGENIERGFQFWGGSSWKRKRRRFGEKKRKTGSSWEDFFGKRRKSWREVVLKLFQVWLPWILFLFINIQFCLFFLGIFFSGFYSLFGCDYKRLSVVLLILLKRVFDRLEGTKIFRVRKVLVSESPILMFLGREFMGLWKCSVFHSVGWFSERKNMRCNGKRLCWWVDYARPTY